MYGSRDRDLLAAQQVAIRLGSGWSGTIGELKRNFATVGVAAEWAMRQLSDGPTPWIKYSPSAAAYGNGARCWITNHAVQLDPPAGPDFEDAIAIIDSRPNQRYVTAFHVDGSWYESEPYRFRDRGLLESVNTHLRQEDIGLPPDHEYQAQRELGHALFERPAGVSAALKRLLDDGRRLRVQLWAGGRPTMSWPWEIAGHPADLDRRMVDDQALSLVRVRGIGGGPAAPPGGWPVNPVLEYVCLDGELDHPETIAAACGEKGWQMRTLDDQAFLGATLDQPNPTVLHVVAHGGDEDTYRRRQPSIAAAVAARGPLLVVLAMCDSARDDLAQGNLARDIIGRGIPWVVGVHGTALLHHTKSFVQKFYLELAVSRSVDSAVHAGRQAPGKLEWLRYRLFHGGRR